jgi:3-dehydroquinate synthase
MVYLNFDFIETLPRSEYESGLGEVIKYCFLSTDINGLVKRDAPMSDIIWACVKFKMEVTQKDLRDNADRRILNLGHTIGHAFERTNDLPHGIAVVLGIYHSLKSFNHSLLNELYSFMQRFNMAESLLFTMPTDEEQFWKYVSKDKKIMGHTINFVVAKSVGYSIVEQISPEELRNKISFK